MKTDTPETDAAYKYWPSENAELVDAALARKLERERDKAREDATNFYAKIGELESQRDDALSQIVQAECRAERFCQERDEAREALDEETKFHHRTHRELVLTQCQLMDVTHNIIATLEQNRHLADGDDCTLFKLKSVVPEWK